MRTSLPIALGSSQACCSWSHPLSLHTRLVRVSVFGERPRSTRSWSPSTWCEKRPPDARHRRCRAYSGESAYLAAPAIPDVLGGAFRPGDASDQPFAGKTATVLRRDMPLSWARHGSAIVMVTGRAISPERLEECGPGINVARARFRWPSRSLRRQTGP